MIKIDFGANTSIEVNFYLCIHSLRRIRRHLLVAGGCIFRGVTLSEGV